jgi:hypothetical protein
MADDLTWGGLPATLPGGDLLPHMSAKRRRQTIDALYVGAGGDARALDWINKSDENYGEFFKIWAKGEAKATSVEVGVGEGVEDLLDRLDRAENAQLINGTVTEIEDAS